MVSNTHSRENNDRRCNVYANIIEEASGARMTVCSGETRHRHLYMTTTNSVEIQIVNAGQNVDEPAYFALAFQGKSYVALLELFKRAYPLNV